MVDNAHGAYLKVLPASRHPIDLGADLCCDSAHKTLPVLTGGAYLHIAPGAPEMFSAQAKNALALFGSTSPSYLILQSLDKANRYISDGYTKKLEDFAVKTAEFKKRLKAAGYALMGNEPLKLTIASKFAGYTGENFAKEILKHNIVCEFSDPDFTVFMLTPETGEEGLQKLEAAIKAIPEKAPLIKMAPSIPRAEKVMSPKEAVFSPKEELPAEKCLGRILASASVSCPPAVPIVVCGEKISEDTIKCFEYYGTKNCLVVKE